MSAPPAPAPARSLAEAAAALTPAEREAFDRLIGEEERAALAQCWAWTARPAQLPPPGDWRIWLMLAGRGFGKTRAGAEWIDALARSRPGCAIALVGASHDDVRNVMIEGESGIMRLPGRREQPVYNPALKRLIWRGGSIARCFSAAEPEAMRGPQHHYACGTGAKGSDPQ